MTCTVCGAVGPGRRKIGLCRRCYARAQHTVRVCTACGQLRRHLAAGMCARCYRLSRTRPEHCPGCGQTRPIHFGDRCERCKRRAAGRAGDCADCGRHVERLWTGRCRSCDQRARETVGECADCRQQVPLQGRRCRACRLFRWGHDLGLCPVCDRELPLGATGRCRGCQVDERARRAAARRPRRPRPTAGPRGEQLLAALDAYGQARGWEPSTLRRTRAGLAALLADHPGLDTPLDAAAVRQALRRRRLPALRVLDFLADQGLVGEEGQAVLDAWLAQRLEPLPTQVQAEVRAWVEALRGRGPRRGRPRQASTIQGYLRAVEPALADWSARYQSLRQVTRDDAAAQLDPVTGPTRRLTLAALRSVFRSLKAQRMVFADPTAGLRGHRDPHTPALGLDPAARAGLLARLDRPEQRLVVVLAGIHALHTAQIRALTLDGVDLAAETLAVDGRPRRLDPLTLTQLHAWLDSRRQRWPGTANPHLLVNQSTAGGLAPVSRSWVQDAARQAGTTIQALRVDRLVGEAHATGGDPLTLTRLFDLSDPTAIRYCADVDPPDLAREVPSRSE